MTAAKPIIRAGTKLLRRKDGKIATSCCPNIYIYSRNYGTGTGGDPEDGFPELICLDPNELTVLWIQRPHYVQVDDRTEPIYTFPITESKIYNNLILCGSNGQHVIRYTDDETLYPPAPYALQASGNVTLFDLGLAQKLVIPTCKDTVIFNGFPKS